MTRFTIALAAVLAFASACSEVGDTPPDRHGVRAVSVIAQIHDLPYHDRSAESLARLVDDRAAARMASACGSAGVVELRRVKASLNTLTATFRCVP